MKNSTTQSGFLRDRQSTLKLTYIDQPQLATVHDFASTNSSDFIASHALHSLVTIDRHNPTDVVVGVHKSVGGDGDAPTPGDILCGAMAACLDSTIRIVVNGMDVLLSRLSVKVTGVVDVRGTLLIDESVPVAFQKFAVHVDFEGMEPLGERQKAMILYAAERSCIVIQTVKGNPDTQVIIDLKQTKQ